MTHRFTPVAVAVATAAAGLVLVTVPAAPASAATVTESLTTALANLPVATENRSGYDRDLFPHWIDADGDGCNARYEVLIAESTTPVDIDSDCHLSNGHWVSWFDGVEATSTSDLSIDHFIPLAEAWDSGARNWTTDRRRSFANDLGDPRALIAVTISSNSSKSDQDPAEWLPPISDITCEYVTNWVAVKTRWSLSVDSTEKSALNDIVAGCPNVDITVDVIDGDGGGDPDPDPTGCGPFTEGTDVNIPDPGIATSEIDVWSCSGTASSTSAVHVDITHDWRGDLSIYLFAPDGTYYVLKRADSGDYHDDVDTTYTVDLSSESRAGTWTLSVKDYWSPDAGTIRSWSITL